jgi:hypothetical protein
MENCLVDGRLQRVYKNLWPSLRDFWLWASQAYSDATYVVFEQQRFTFGEVFQRSVQAAGMYRAIYGIQKGWSSVSFWPCDFDDDGMIQQVTELGYVPEITPSIL